MQAAYPLIVITLVAENQERTRRGLPRVLLTFEASAPRTTTSLAVHIETDVEMSVGSTAVGSRRREGAGAGAGVGAGTGVGMGMYTLESGSGSSVLVPQKGVGSERGSVVE